MDVVAEWTGSRADALRQALRMTNESFAGHLGVAVRTVASWRQRPDVIPLDSTQEILDTALARAPEAARAQFRELLATRDRGRVLVTAGSAPPPAGSDGEDVGDLIGWLTESDTSDEAISSLDRLATALAESHTQVAPAVILDHVRDLSRTARRRLRSGRHRPSQTRELLRISGGLLAHQSLLLSDLDDYAAADTSGHAALLCLREAGASEVTAWYVLAKSARWQHRHLQAADLAGQGLQRSSPGPMRVQLACYEANTSALLGDTRRARNAMRLAEEAATAVPANQDTLSPWAFPPERMTIFRLAVALGTGDPDAALRAAAGTAAAWDPDGPHVPAAWAQIRVCAGIAHLMKDELEGTAEQVTAMLALPARYRIATVTGWLDDLDHRLTARRFASSPIAADLRQQIREFSAGTPGTEQTQEDQ